MTEPLVDLRNVSVVRDGRTILHRLNLSIPVGQHVAILGANGSGKSTLIKLLTREIYPFAGEGSVRILGETQWLQRELRTVLAAVSGEPKEPLLGSPSVRDVVLSGHFGTYGVLWGYDVTADLEARADDVMEQLEIRHLAHRDVTTLSAGEHRRAFIARALINRPVGLVLDEPTTSLDLRAANSFVKTMRRLASAEQDTQVTLVLVTHHLEEIIPEIERVILLREGRVVADGPTGVTLTDESMSEMFGARLRIVSRFPFRAVFDDEIDAPAPLSTHAIT